MSKLPGDGGSSRLSVVVFAPSCWFNECALDYMHACTHASCIRAHAREYTNACTCTLAHARVHIHMQTRIHYLGSGFRSATRF